MVEKHFDISPDGAECSQRDNLEGWGRFCGEETFIYDC
jgi:hypothetical protein